MKKSLLNKGLLGGVLLVSLGLLAACGGSSSSGGTSSSAVEGAAVKGILKNANVAIHEIKDGAMVSPPLATAITDDDGKYSVAVKYKGPALIKVSGNDDATMTCDIPQGCADGTKDFGEDVPFAADQSLEAVAILDGGAVSVNVTPLTHLAASKTQKTLSESPSADASQVIALDNSQVANLFGLTGSLTSLPVVDITKPEALAAAGDDAQKAALVAAALYGDAIGASKTLDDVAEDFADNGGQFTGNALASVYEVAGDIVALEVFSDAEDLDFSGIASTLAAAQSDNENLGPDLTDAQPSPDAVSPDLVKTKNFVTQVRTLGTTFVTEDSVNAFVDEFQAAETLLADDANELFELLAQIAGAVAKVHEEVMNENGPDEFPHVRDGVEIKRSADKKTYTVTEVSDSDVEINITITPGYTVSETENETDNSYDFKETLGVNFNISGQLSSDTLELKIVEGKGVASGTYTEKETWNDAAGVDDESFSATFNFDLKVELNARDDSASLAGGLNVDVKGYKETFKDTWENDEDGYSYEGDSTTTFNTAKLGFNGKVTTENNELDVVFSFNAKSNGYVLTEKDSGGDIYEDGQWVDWEEEPWHTTSTETASKYIGGSFSLIAKAVLAEVGESKVEINGTRDGLNKGNASVKITYPVGKSLTISAPLTRNSDGDVPPPKVTIVNQDGVTATLEVNEDDEIFGDIKVGNKTYADITEPNAIVVRYTDGTIESLQ